MSCMSQILFDRNIWISWYLLIYSGMSRYNMHTSSWHHFFRNLVASFVWFELPFLDSKRLGAFHRRRTLKGCNLKVLPLDIIQMKTVRYPSWTPNPISCMFTNKLPSNSKNYSDWNMYPIVASTSHTPWSIYVRRLSFQQSNQLFT